MEIYKANRTLPRAFICDIDGTLTDHEGIRGHFEYQKVLQDRPIYPIIHIVQALIGVGVWIPLFVSGREEYSRNDTIEWIDIHGQIEIPNPASHYHEEPKLFMRPDGDYRKDYVVKSEIFDNYIRDHYWVEFALDDRNQVVNMWRQADLPCLQVAPGDF